MHFPFVRRERIPAIEESERIPAIEESERIPAVKDRERVSGIKGIGKEKRRKRNDRKRKI